MFQEWSYLPCHAIEGSRWTKHTKRCKLQIGNHPCSGLKKDSKSNLQNISDPWQPVRADNEQIRWQRITLAQSPYWGYTFSSMVVKVHLIFNWANADHNISDPFLMKTNPEQYFCQETPFNSVKGFTHVYFKGCKSLFLTFSASNIVINLWQGLYCQRYCGSLWKHFRWGI